MTLLMVMVQGDHWDLFLGVVFFHIPRGMFFFIKTGTRWFHVWGGETVSFRIIGLQRLQPFDMGNGCFIPGV